MSGMRKKVQAKDIPDREVLEIVDAVIRSRGGGEFTTATCIDLEFKLPAFPNKVVRAKARALVLRGLMEGCDSPGCTCRGDFRPTAAGRELLRSR